MSHHWFNTVFYPYLDTYGYGISVAQGFTGIVCILIGVYFMLFGYRFFRPTLALTGFVFFAFMTWIGLVNNEPPGGFPNNEITYICVSVGLGLLGAALFMFFYPVGLYGVGSKYSVRTCTRHFANIWVNKQWEVSFYRFTSCHGGQILLYNWQVLVVKITDLYFVVY